VATLTDSNGLAYALNGVMERNGRFWVDHVPWLAGTNVVTLTITDAANNVTNLYVTNYQSTLGFTMFWPTNNGDGGLWNTNYAGAGGTVDIGYAVWVNGVEMPVGGDGSWGSCATNGPPPIPISPGGVATFNIPVYPPGEDPVGTFDAGNGSGAGYQNPFDPNAVVYEFNLDKPQRVYVSGDEQSMSTTIQIELDTPTIESPVPTNVKRRSRWASQACHRWLPQMLLFASRTVDSATNDEEARLHLTEPPNAFGLRESYCLTGARHFALLVAL
jgi:hypothetical protein